MEVRKLVVEVGPRTNNNTEKRNQKVRNNKNKYSIQNNGHTNSEKISERKRYQGEVVSVWIYTWKIKSQCITYNETTNEKRSKHKSEIELLLKISKKFSKY